MRDNTFLKRLAVRSNNLDGQSMICFMINHEQISLRSIDFSDNQIRFSLLFVLLNYLKNGPLTSIKG